MNMTFNADQEQAIEHVEAMRFARQAAIDAKTSTIGPIAMRDALAPLRELVDATESMDYRAALALATAMGGRDARTFTLGGLLLLLERIPA